MNREFAFAGTTAKYAPDRVVTVQHVHLVLDVDPAHHRVGGTASLTVRAITSARVIELDAVELEIVRVERDGTRLPHHHDGRRLRLELDRPLGPGEAATFDISYRGQPRRGLYFVGPDEGYPDKPAQVWTQGQDEDSRFWFPCFDSPDQKATSEVVVTMPAGLTSLSNGLLIGDRTADGKRRQHWRLDVPHSCYLITLVVGEFAVVHARWRDLPLTYLAPPGREAAAERTLRRTPDMLELFSQRFGITYPYPSYAQVFVADFIFGGMENTSATTLTDLILVDERAALDYDIDALVAHELAHQWFGDLVTCRDWGEGWLNEGFATYAEYIWREAYEGRDAADLELADWGEAYLHEDGARYRRPIATKLYDEPIDIFDHHLYDKGGRVLHMVRALLGDEGFFASLRTYLGRHRHGVVETRDLARAIEATTGRVLDWFFAQWVEDGAGHPELEVTLRWDATLGQLEVRAKQTQTVDARTPLFRVPTQIRVVVDGVARDLPIELREREQAWFIPLAAEPSQAIWDPGRVVLATVRCDKPETWWIVEAQHAVLATDRLAAIAELGKRGSPAGLTALERSLLDDPFWAVRAGAAAALASRRGTAGRDRLLARLNDEAHPRARRGLVKALGEYRHDATVATALTALVTRGDASYFVEAEACLALGKTRLPEALAALEPASRRESFTDVIRQHAYRGLAESRLEAALPILLAGLAWGKPSGGRRAAASALAQLCRGRRDRDARGVRERLEELLGDRDFRVQAAAIEALAVLGDPDAIAGLQGLITRELDGRLRRRAREVVRDLSEGNAGLPELRRLRDDVEQLTQSMRDVQARLDKADAVAAGPGPSSSTPPAAPPASRRTTGSRRAKAAGAPRTPVAKRKRR